MDNPGAFQLTFSGAAFQLSGAATLYGDVLCGLEGMASVSLQATFNYVAGGASPTAALYVQSSLDQGQTWFDIWAQQFTNASDAKIVSLFAASLTGPVALQSLGLSFGTVLNGVLGDRLRAVAVIGGGGYSGGTLLNVTGVAR
jgi:hypothetical protein